jgi:hypothetical protein
MINIVLLFLFSGNFFNPPFLDGYTGFYTTKGSFDKRGIIRFSLYQTQSQTNLNIVYTPFSFSEIGGALNYYTREKESNLSGFLKPRFPLLTMKKTKMSLAPIFIFFRDDKPQYGGNLNLEFIPFQNSNLPPFHFGNSFEVIKRNSGKKLIYSTLLSIQSKRFQPFIEYYTELTELFDFSSTVNSRFCSGIAFRLGVFGLKGGVEIALDEKVKRNFDYRFTGGVNLLWDTKKKPVVPLNILVKDAESGTPVQATVTLKRNNMIKKLKTEHGRCTFTDLSSGIYTLEISNPEYKSLKVPLFIREKPLTKTYTIKKIERR